MSKDSFRTQTVGKGVAKTDPVRLAKTENTAIHFEPILHDGGVRGRLIKYKKSSNKEWSDLAQSDFASHPLSSMEKVVIDMDTATTTKLLEALVSRSNIVEQGIKRGLKNYVVAEKDTTLIINDKNKHQVLQRILEEGLSEDYWHLIASSQPNLAAKLVAGHIQQIRAEQIAELQQRLTENHAETIGENSWQSWIYRHHWMFGVNYQEPIEKQKINLQGVMPDYLFPTIDGFVDLLEIKLPTEKVVVPDTQHPGSYRWTAETSKAIGQVVHYISEIERLQNEIERHIRSSDSRGISMLRPRAFILIGNSEHWTEADRGGLRRLNHSLHGIEVLTYQELLTRSKAFLTDIRAENIAQIAEHDL